jgi:hypothetical protein
MDSTPRRANTPWEEGLDQFAACWEGLEDPRTGNAGLHDFHELLVIALCTVLCGGQGAVDMALFARAKEPFLRGFLKLANGVPSHDTFSRLFRQLDPVQFRAAFQRFMASFSKTLEGVVAIDGKVLRRSFGDLVDARASEALAEKQVLGRIENSSLNIAGQVLRRPAALGRLLSHARVLLCF